MVSHARTCTHLYAHCLLYLHGRSYALALALAHFLTSRVGIETRPSPLPALLARPRWCKSKLNVVIRLRLSFDPRTYDSLPFYPVCNSQPLLLDSSIRDWVLIPILVVMILVGLVRHYITQLITSPPKAQAPDVVRQQRILARAATLRANHVLVPRPAFRSRLDWLADVLDRGVYVKAEEPKKPGEGDMPKNPLSDPAQMDQMMDMAKKSMVSMVPQTVIMGWINYFFTGFVLSTLHCMECRKADVEAGYQADMLYQSVFHSLSPFASS